MKRLQKIAEGNITLETIIKKYGEQKVKDLILKAYKEYCLNDTAWNPRFDNINEVTNLAYTDILNELESYPELLNDKLAETFNYQFRDLSENIGQECIKLFHSDNNLIQQFDSAFKTYKDSYLKNNVSE